MRLGYRMNSARFPMANAARLGNVLVILVCISTCWFIQPDLGAKVFTTRPGTGIGQLTNPSSFGARLIYGGRFRVNGALAEMQLYSSQFSVMETYGLLNKEGIRARASRSMVVGVHEQAGSERRFLMTSAGGNSSLVFVLQNGARLELPKIIPWPAGIPRLDPLQVPQLVVEHLETRTIFASVAIPGGDPARVLELASGELARDGWGVESLGEDIAIELAQTGFAVLEKRGKICWLEARPGTTPNQVVLTLLCKKT
jgi:hypothetical protein